jgi:hypothetical protein
MAGFVPQSLFLVGLVACCLRWDQSPIARLRSPILFFRQKRSGDRVCLRVVENLGEEGRCLQKVIATLSRVDQLRECGPLDALLQSGSKFAAQFPVVSAHKAGQAPSVQMRRVGPSLVFWPLWHATRAIPCPKPGWHLGHDLGASSQG